jgi:hypothetical protein
MFPHLLLEALRSRWVGSPPSRNIPLEDQVVQMLTLRVTERQSVLVDARTESTAANTHLKDMRSAESPDDERCDIAEQRVKLAEKVFLLCQRELIAEEARKVAWAAFFAAPTTDPPVLTSQLACGMLARDSEFCDAQVWANLALMPTAPKEHRVPLVVVAAPRQGKSLFLQNLAAKLQSEPVRASMTIHSVQVTFNGYAATWRGENPEAGPEQLLGYFWTSVFATMWHCSREIVEPVVTAIGASSCFQLLRSLMDELESVVILADELSHLIDGMHVKACASKMIGFCDGHVALALTCFTRAVRDSFLSESGVPPFKLFLGPVTDRRRRRDLLPLKTGLFSLMQKHPRAPTTRTGHLNWLSVYEASKATPGLLGAVLEAAHRQFRSGAVMHEAADIRECIEDVPLLAILRRQWKQRLAWPVLRRYMAAVAKGEEIDDDLQAELFKEFLGTAVSDHAGVHVSPLFATVLLDAWVVDDLPSDPVVELSIAALTGANEWNAALLTATNQDELARLNGARMETAVAAGLLVRDALLGNVWFGGSPRPKPPSAVPELLFEYPVATIVNQQAPELCGLKMCCERAALVDVVYWEDGGATEHWVQCKHTTHSPFDGGSFVSTQTLFNSAWKSVAENNEVRVRMGLPRVTCVVYTLIGPCGTKLHDGWSDQDAINKCFQPPSLAPASYAAPASSPLQVRFYGRFVELGGAAAAELLTPFVAAMIPTADALPIDSWERKPWWCEDPHDSSWVAVKEHLTFLQRLSDSDRQFHKRIIDECILMRCSESSP